MVGEQHYVIEFNVPMKGNENAFGLDLASLPSQRAPVEAARDSGEIVATGRIPLVQDAARHLAIVARAPIYRPGMATGSVAQRRAAFIGVVVIVFRVDDLMRELIEPSLLAHMALQIIDQGDAKQGVARPAGPLDTLFDSRRDGTLTLSRLAAQGHIDVAQRHWLVQYRALADSRYARDITMPLLIAAAGIVISSLIAALLGAQRASLAELERQKSQGELAHGDLSSVLATLKQAQASLITSEKLASLGALVAGIAHELNTPIGNSLLTATALADMVSGFEKKYAAGGIKRSALGARSAHGRDPAGVRHHGRLAEPGGRPDHVVQAGVGRSDQRPAALFCARRGRARHRRHLRRPAAPRQLRHRRRRAFDAGARFVSGQVGAGVVEPDQQRADACVRGERRPEDRNQRARSSTAS